MATVSVALVAVVRRCSTRVRDAGSPPLEEPIIPIISTAGEEIELCFFPFSKVQGSQVPLYIAHMPSSTSEY
jgi:hypothetical protein